MNDITKIQSEYRAEVASNHTVWLKIRLTPGMEMLAQEMSTGRRIFEQDLKDLPASPSVGYMPADDTEPSPTVSPSSPSSPASPSSPQVHAAITRRRSQRWMLDATGSFPTLFIDERMVGFYSNRQEFDQAKSEAGPEGRSKIILNIANIISIEKVLVRQSYAQNMTYPDTANGVGWQQPPVAVEPLTVREPTGIPAITKPDQELMFRIEAVGGHPPYRYAMLNAPTDLYVTEDGWVRGYIEEDQWPATGYRDFMTLILVEDSSIPVQTTGLEFRYRLYQKP